MEEKLIAWIEEDREDKFYNSWIWRKKRLEIIDRDNNECQVCREAGRVGKGEVVHHIKHVRKYPKLCMTEDNLLTVCNHCHNTLHPEKSGHTTTKTKPINEERW